MKIILSIIALVLFTVVHLVSTVVMLFTGIKARKWYQLINSRAFEDAFNIDVFGNYQYGWFWNLIFSRGGYKFGRFGETLSSCFGKKQVEGTLSFVGWIVLIIINVIDFSKWFKGGHCIAAIQTRGEIRNFLKRTNE
tara:strand:- start:24630 stop:25040 length:411 start_codon:yes stop_codon:yes gene_type:complete